MLFYKMIERMGFVGVHDLSCFSVNSNTLKCPSENLVSMSPMSQKKDSGRARAQRSQESLCLRAFVRERGREERKTRKGEEEKRGCRHSSLPLVLPQTFHIVVIQHFIFADKVSFG